MRVICYGDSNTFGYDPQAMFGEHYHPRWTDSLSELTGWDVVNDGVNGREVPRERLSIPEDTDLFLVMLGTNDLLQLDTPEAAAERMAHFLSGADPHKVILIAPPAMTWGLWVQDEELIADSQHLAQLYQELAQQLGICFVNAGQWGIPLSPDGVHFTQEGQGRFAENLAQVLMNGGKAK